MRLLTRYNKLKVIPGHSKDVESLMQVDFSFHFSNVHSFFTLIFLIVNFSGCFSCLIVIPINPQSSSHLKVFVECLRVIILLTPVVSIFITSNYTHFLLSNVPLISISVNEPLVADHRVFTQPLSTKVRFNFNKKLHRALYVYEYTKFY